MFIFYKQTKYYVYVKNAYCCENLYQLFTVTILYVCNVLDKKLFKSINLLFCSVLYIYLSFQTKLFYCDIVSVTMVPTHVRKRQYTIGQLNTLYYGIT